MNDTVIEQLVKRKKTADVTLKRVGLILVTLFSATLWGGGHPLLMWLTMGLIVADVILFPRMNVEFEYVYFQGDLDIDKIMNKQSRKRKFSTSVKEMEIIAPTGSGELHSYQQLKAFDFSTKVPENKTYEMVTEFKGEKVRVIFEPNEKMLNEIRYIAPRKVIL